MRAHRADTTVSGDGSVTIRGVPFSEGALVEVIVLPRPLPAEARTFPLRGSVQRYDVPFKPVTDADDWNAA